jgi:hypothetical protein
VTNGGTLLGQKRSIAIMEDHGDGSWVEGMSDPLLSTHNDFTRKYGYKSQFQMQAFTTRYDFPVNFRVTDGQNDTVATYFQNAVHGPTGTGFVPEPRDSLMVLDKNSFCQPFPLDRTAVVGMASRPRGKRAPYVRSWLNDRKIKDAVDAEIRGNMAANEWQTTMPHVYEQGNGFALAGAAYASSVANPDTF